MVNSYNQGQFSPQKTWLLASAVMVLVMIFIGGLTRLSDAGLSIVEWKPITGIIPPLSEMDWNIEFSKYKSSPEFKFINNNIDIKGFKDIFWLEFIHRIAARLTGIIVFIPLLYFYFVGKFSLQKDKKYLLLPILLIAQALMGWYMVKSGLVKNPHVSHFRLGAHLILAVILYHHLVSYLINYGIKIRKDYSVGNLTKIILISIYIQIFLGALVAGLDAGLIYNTFPMMGGSFIPSELFSHNQIIEIFYDPASVQFLHRIMAYILTSLCIIKAWKLKNSSPIHSISLIFAILLQFTLGILTLLNMVEINIALMHQMGAMLLLTVVININDFSDKKITY